MANDNIEVKAIIKRLQESFNQTLDALYDLPQEYLQQPCAHGCARGGAARDLLVHNIVHEKQHTGQVWSVRDQLRIPLDMIRRNAALIAGRIFRVARGESSRESLDLIAREVDPQDLPLLRAAVEPLLDAPTSAVRDAAAWALTQ